MENKSVILVNLGIFQDYINDNIENLLRYKNNVVLIIDENLIPFVKEKEKITIIKSEDLNLDYFEKKSRYDTKFRQGFWKNTSKRLFCVFEAMKKFNIEKCFHIENDVLIFGNTEEINTTDDRLYLVMDNKRRCIPSIIYIPDYRFLNKLIEDYRFRKNDMENMQIFYNRNKDIVSTFPIINQNNLYKEKTMYNENFQQYNMIFDGAAIGQYLGGIDPRNKGGDTKGFINEKTVINYSKFKFLWKNIENNKKLFIIIDEEEIPVFNIHVHCKNLKQFI